jgi:hypothetical protein
VNESPYHKAVQTAAERVATYATAEVRSRAIQAGWDMDVIESTRVSVKDGKFTADISDSAVGDRAFTSEYGDGSNPPSAVLRRYGAESDSPAADLFASQVLKHLEEVV